MVILETVVPVFLFIAIGKFLKAKDIITDESISFIKFICLNILFNEQVHSFSGERYRFVSSTPR